MERILDLQENKIYSGMAFWGIQDGEGMPERIHRSKEGIQRE